MTDQNSNNVNVNFGNSGQGSGSNSLFNDNSNINLNKKVINLDNGNEKEDIEEPVYNNAYNRGRLVAPPIMDHMTVASNYDSRLRSLATPSGVVIRDSGSTTYSKWPVQLYAPDVRDHEIQLRKAALTNPLGVDGIGQVMAPSDYFEYLDRKRQMVQKADFESWLYSHLDLSTPANMDWAKRNFPDLFTNRILNFQKTQANVTKAALINIRGPESVDDYLFMYGLDRGLIKLPSSPAYVPESIQSDSFEEGLFSISRLLPWKVTDFSDTKNATDNKISGITYSNPLTYNNPTGDTYLPSGNSYNIKSLLNL